MAMACAFTPWKCTHDNLFSAEYQRTNRTQRTKIIRCFPHCCPSHINRSYCGSPVYLRVDANIAPDPRLVVVFARFRAADSPSFRLGSTCSLASITDAVQSSTATTAQWVPSILHATQPDGAWVFEVNPTARWFYAWNSGATKQQRLTTHVLEAVVFRRIRSTTARYWDSVVGGHDADDGTYTLNHDHLLPPLATSMLEAVVTVSSPSFTFISFRRATNDSDARRRPSLLYRALAWECTVTSEEQPPAPTTTSLKRFCPTPQSSDANKRSLLSMRTGTTTAATTTTTTGLPTATTAAIASPATSTPVVGPSHYRGFSTTGMTVNETNKLTRLLSQITCLTQEQLTTDQVADVLPSMRALWRARVQWRHRCQSREQYQSATTATFGYASLISSASKTHAVEIGSHLLLWLLTDDDIHRARRAYVAQASNVLLNRAALVTYFECWLRCLHRLAERFLAECGWSITQLTNSIEMHRSNTAGGHRLGHSSGRDETRSPNKYLLDWQGFVADARQHCITQQRREAVIAKMPGPHGFQLDNLEYLLRSHQSYHSHWFCDADSVIAYPHNDAAHETRAPSLGLATVYSFWQQLSYLVVDFSDVISSLRSRFSMGSALHTTDLHVQLVLDDTYRWFDSLPHGESTTGNAWPSTGQRFGNYTGHVSADGTKMEVVMFSWPDLLVRESDGVVDDADVSTRAAYRWRWQCLIPTEENPSCQVMLDIDSAKVMGAHAGTVDFTCMSIQDRLRHVENWNVMYHVRALYQRLQVN